MEWIKVSDRLPQEYEKIIVAYCDADMKNSYSDFAKYQEGEFKSVDPSEEFLQVSIFKWMPLPNPSTE